jgi:hypothetical protein
MKARSNHHKHRPTPFVVRCGYDQAVALPEYVRDEFDHLGWMLPPPSGLREALIEWRLPRPVVRRFLYAFGRM